MTTSTAPITPAWLAKAPVSLGPLVVRLVGDRRGFGALESGLFQGYAPEIIEA